MKITTTQKLSINQEIERAKTLIENNNHSEAFSIFEEIYNKINTIDAFSETKKEIESYLINITNLEKIKSPELLYEFSARDLAPQRILSLGENLYFFTPFSNKIVSININTKESREYFLPIDRNSGPNSARIINNNPIFFARPNKLFSIKDDDLEIMGELKEPNNSYSFNNFSVFLNSLYFWDTENREIIRYTGYNSNPQNWFSDETKKPTDIKSMSVDGSIWIIDRDNTLLRYSGGSLAQEININVFPFLESPSHIYTSPSLYDLFILEAASNRIIITNKQGEVIRQLQSDKFNNLVHFSLSQDGNDIYVLNNLQVYKVNLR